MKSAGPLGEPVPSPPSADPGGPALGRVTRFRRGVTNGVIAGWLMLAVLQGFPEVAPALQVRANQVAMRLGLEHPAWSMFTPDPDRTNDRVLAELTLADGSLRFEPVSPDWRTLGPGARLRLHRWCEYFDQIIQRREPELLSALARRIHAEQVAQGRTPRSLRLVVESQEIALPRWSAARAERNAAPAWERSLLWIEEFP